MGKKYADVSIHITVEFEDDGEFSLVDQALDAAKDAVSIEYSNDADMEIVGQVRDTKS